MPPPLSLPLSQSHLAFQIFGSNTNVGKTIISAGLCHIASPFFITRYIKPLQSGYPTDSDVDFLQSISPLTKSKVLFTYNDAVSPHLAAEREGRVIKDEELLHKLDEVLWENSSEQQQQLSTFTVLEGAGGVLSPSATGKLQADVYRPFRFPSVLVGDSLLGGISSTLCAYESLLIRGYSIPAVCLFENQLSNQSIIERNVEKNTSVFVVPQPPLNDQNRSTDILNLQNYYKQSKVSFTRLFEYLVKWNEERVTDVQSMADRANQSVWYPFTQHKSLNSSQITTIDSAFQDNFSVYDNHTQSIRQLYDGSASWFTQGVGHGHPNVAKRIAHAAGRYGHVMFPECIHNPALKLSETVLEQIVPWASRVFFSDNGSTAVEVALKMAFGYSHPASLIPKKSEIKVLGINGGYHGDTIGAMDASNPSVFNNAVHWYKPRGFWFNAPKVQFKNGIYHLRFPAVETYSPESYTSLDSLFDKNRDEMMLADTYRRWIRDDLNELNLNEFGALIIEPVVMGAGGMQMVDPLFQRILVQTVREEADKQNSKIPVIFDEVFVGMWRLGVGSTSELLDVNPDIACYSKALSGGVLPISITVATDQIFDTFKGNTKLKALLHGHSYTGSAVGCEAALAAMDLYKKSGRWENGKLNGLFHATDDIILRMSHCDGIVGMTVIGNVLAVELESERSGYDAKSDKVERIMKSMQGVHMRALGNVIYILASHLADKKNVDKVLKQLLKALETIK